MRMTQLSLPYIKSTSIWAVPISSRRHLTTVPCGLPGEFTSAIGGVLLHCPTTEISGAHGRGSKLFGLLKPDRADRVAVR